MKWITPDEDVLPLIKKLQLLSPGFSAKDRVFADDLISTFVQYGHLSEKQLFWVKKFIGDDTVAELPVPPSTLINIGWNWGNVVHLFTVAKDHVTRPRVTLFCEGKPIILTMASKYPGWVNIHSKEHYLSREWYGRVSPTGGWQVPKLLPTAMKEALQQLLTTFSEHPGAVAKAQGQVTGLCCFCGKILKQAQSIAAGFGQKCAHSYGLGAEWLGMSVDVSFGTTENILSLDDIPLVSIEDTDFKESKPFIYAKKKEFIPYTEKPFTPMQKIISELLDTPLQQPCVCYLCEQSKTECLPMHGFMVCPSCRTELE